MTKLGYLHDKLIPGAGYYTIQNIPTEKSAGIIYKTDKQEAFLKGKVIKVGKNLVTEYNALQEPEYKEGDIVLYSFSGFEELIEQGDTINLIRFRAVHAKYV